MSWLFLMLAVLFDVTGTVFLKLSNGFSRLLPAALTLFFYGASFVPLALAVRHLPIGIAYAVWSAVGTAMVVAIGIIWFKEPASMTKMFSLALILVGLIGLNIGGRAQW